MRVNRHLGEMRMFILMTKDYLRNDVFSKKKK